MWLLFRTNLKAELTLPAGWGLPNFSPMEAIPTSVCLTSYNGGPDAFMRTPLQEMVEQIEAGTLSVTNPVLEGAEYTPGEASDVEVGPLEIFCEIDFHGVEVGDVYRFEA